MKIKLYMFVIILTAAFLAAPAYLTAGSGGILKAGTKTPPSAASEEIELMRIQDVKVGMKGVGKTVVHGFEIEDFDVEILGVLKNNKIDDSLQISGSSFLVQVSGEVIEKSGGIAAGMSGSPVYIDGKLAGAVSSGWVMADHSVGLLTPIEEMTGLFKYMKKEKKSGVNVNDLIDRDVMLFIDKSPKVAACYKGVKIGAENAGNIDEKEYMIFEKASTPLMVTGLNNRNFDLLNQNVKRSGYNVKLVNAESTPSFGSDDFTVPELRAGHAIAAQLVKGDINITAIGTLTYLKDNRFLAFAHSFLKKGDASYFFTPANIYYCFSSPEMPFKIGAPGQLIGSVTVDRNEGIAGLLGVMPHVVNVHTVVRDLDNKLKREFSAHVVNDNAMFADLLQSILTQSIDEGINRQGEGFAKVAYSVNGRSEKNGEFKINRKNYFYDEADIASSSINELMSTVRTVIANPFEKTCFYDVTCEFDISADNPAAVVGSVSVGGLSYNSGDSIEISVKVEPKYKKSFIENFTIPVPENLENGKYNLKITNAFYSPELFIEPGAFVEKEGDPLEMRMKKQAGAFTDLVGKLNSTERSNQLVFEFCPDDAAKDPAGQNPSAADGGGKSVKPSNLEKSKPGQNKSRDDGEILKSRERDGGRAKPQSAFNDNRLRALADKISGILQLVSSLKSAISEKHPAVDKENIKLYKSIEYIIEPFETQFSIDIGNTAFLDETAENILESGTGEL